MQATILQALVLETFSDIFEKVEDGQTKKIPYSKLIIYEFGQKYPKATILKLPQSLKDQAQKIVGQRVDVLVKVFQKGNKMELTFEGVAGV